MRQQGCTRFHSTHPIPARPSTVRTVTHAVEQFGWDTPTNSPAVHDRIGIGQLRASASTYLDRVAAGETIDVRLQPPT